MPSILSETTLSLADAVCRLPRGRDGNPICFSTVFRWAMRGIIAPSGERVRLEAIRLGGRWITSHEALQRFVERLTPDLGDADSVRTPAARKRAGEVVSKKLEKMGI